MIEFHNFKKEEPIQIYFKDVLIGECKNYVSFLDVRVQVKEEKSSDYSFEFKGIKYSIDKNGQIPTIEDEDFFGNRELNYLLKLI